MSGSSSQSVGERFSGRRATNFPDPPVFRGMGTKRGGAAGGAGRGRAAGKNHLAAATRRFFAQRTLGRLRSREARRRFNEQREALANFGWPLWVAPVGEVGAPRAGSGADPALAAGRLRGGVPA